MDYTGSYALVLSLHLLTVAFLVGPSAVAAMSSARHARAGDAAALRAAARTTRICTRGTVLTVVLGSAMVGLGDVGGQWEMSQAWVSASYALWILAAGLLLAVVVPAQEKAAAAGEGASAYAGRIGAAAGLATLAYAAVVVLMVVKPGA